MKRNKQSRDGSESIYFSQGGEVVLDWGVQELKGNGWVMVGKGKEGRS